MSEKNQFVILVNPSDIAIGQEEKILAHRYGMLHRAFSILIFRDREGKKEILLQQRNKQKYHAGGLWTNTCCSHPQPQEKSLQQSAENRLKDEMGIDVSLQKKGVFHYLAKFDNGLYENEIDHVFIGYYDSDDTIPVNPDEVEDYRWVEVTTLQQDLEQSPTLYTPWLKQALQIALAY